MSRRKSQVLMALFLFIVASGSVFFLNSRKDIVQNQTPKTLTKAQVANVLGEPAAIYHFPAEVSLQLNGSENTRAKIQYSFDMKLQKSMEALFDSYRPDHGAFVAMDAETGRVLSMVSFSKDGNISDNLALRATFPSASVFKVVTAAAAIEAHKISADTVIPFNGRLHTLYRGQILNSNVTRWTHFMTLRQAFARSVNTVFGKIGAFTVGSDGLRNYADRFGFNRTISADLPIQQGLAKIPEDSWGLAEAASGYTRDNTMSPLQGALIAASVANSGVMMEPYIVDSISNDQGAVLYSAKPKVASIPIHPSTAQVMRLLMKETVLSGTSRSSFRGFFRKNFSSIDVGGKTGSLTGSNPPGKYDWFVGYADSGSRRIALAALTIHGRQWRVKSSYLARRAIENLFVKEMHPNQRSGKTVARR